LITLPPAAMVRIATLWPRGIVSRTVNEVAPVMTCPVESASSAVATLSRSLMTMTGFTG
jgi:hypothetical protein